MLRTITHNKLYRLLSIISTYDIAIYANDLLIDEVQRNLPHMLKSGKVGVAEVVEELLGLVALFTIVPTFTQSPDPKDNFLFDLALQTGSEVIVSDEKKLLLFEESPVPVRSLKWFKETFPVEL